MKLRQILLWTVGIVMALVVISFGMAAPQWILAGYAANGNLKGAGENDLVCPFIL